MRILAINDHFDNLISLGAMIREIFPDSILDTARNGQQGIDLAVSNEPDVILLDIYMSGMDGFEICDRLKQRERVRDIPVIFIVPTKDDKQSRIKALEVGADGFLARPLDESELFAQIRAMVKVKQAVRRKSDENEYLSQLDAGHVTEPERNPQPMAELVEKLKAEAEAHKETEIALRASEELFRNIFEFHTAVKLIIDPDTGNIMDANRASELFYGWPKEQLKQMNVRDINLNSPEKIHQSMEMAQTRKKEHFEFQHRLADGSIRDVEVFSSIIEVKGKFLLHSIVHDISSRKQAERAINISEARLRRAELASKSGNWELHLDSQMVVASRGAAKIYGVEADQLNYEVIKGFSLPEYRSRLDEAFRMLTNDVSPYEIEFKIQTADTGEIKDIHSVAQYDRENRIVFGVIQDITERKQAEAEILKSKQQYDNLVSKIPVGVYILKTKPDETFALEYASPRMAEMLDLSVESLLADHETIFKAIHPGDLDGFVRLNLEGIQQKRPFNWKGRVVVKGDVRWLHISSLPHLLENGDVFWHGLVVDITDRVRDEAEIKLKNEELINLNATKDRLFSIIAHDLVNPFNSIVGFSNLLYTQMDENDLEGIEKYAGIILDSSRQAMDLLLNLLEWSRSQIGGIRFNPAKVEINGLIRDVVMLLTNVARQKSITISNELHRIVTVVADATMISTILRNLISNAIKFTNPGGEIVINVKQKASELEFTVSDNGVGIKKESIGKLFRIDEPISTQGTKDEKGTGLGLILCKEFVEKHGGKIWVESTAGKGSTFYFTIPKI